MHISIVLFFLAMLSLISCSSCSESKKKQQVQSVQTYDYGTNDNSVYVDSNYRTTPAMTPQEASEALKRIPTMSREEDAYEEGRALREEDHLNGTRMHEGDDYDDDYDEGYDE